MSLDLDAAKMLAAMVKIQPRMLELAKEQKTFEDLERMLVAEIANADSTSGAISAYTNYGSLLPDWKFVFASNKGPVPGFAVNRTFSDGSVVRGLFSATNVVVLDREIHGAMLANATVTFPIDYSIALDTQALSYLAPYIEGKTSSLAKDFHEIFQFIARGDVYVDPVPYITENLPNILIEKNVSEIRRRLTAYEMLRTIDEEHLRDTGQIRSISSEEERKRIVEKYVIDMLDNASDSEVMTAVQFRHTLCYCVLLKMTSIQLRSKTKTPATKLQELVDFMDAELHTMWLREIVVAAEYFKRGQNLAFFGKIQKAPAAKLSDQFAVLKGMAWDFWHIRYLESAATNEDTMPESTRIKPRYFFPALLTCDKRFIEIIDLYPLKSYAYQQGRQIPLPFPALDWIDIAAGTGEARAQFENKYLSRQAVQRRETLRVGLKAKLPAMVKALEEDFAKAATALS